jgi:excisionase family DNA binding protein
VLHIEVSRMSSDPISSAPTDHYTTLEVARMLGMAVRSVQLMVDRGDLEAWKTPGGHRRISRDSVERWLASRQGGRIDGSGSRPRAGGAPRVLLIEDSTHFQNLVSLLVKQQFPHVELSIADDGISGLAMVGQLQPQVLLIDILLPGIDGGTLITSLRSHERFRDCKLVVLTSLDAVQREPYRYALDGLPVIHKPDLVRELPGLLSTWVGITSADGAATAAA